MAVYLQPDEVMNWNGLTVNKYFITEHNVNHISMPSKRTKPLKGITVHNTDWINVNSATTPAEQYSRACVSGNLNSVRVSYFVDNVCVWQNLPDDWQSWHAADGNGDGNTATISIECIMRNSTDEVSLKSRDNCARLVAYLCVKYNLTTDNVFTHTYWLNVRDGYGKNLSKDERCVLKHSYKMCPYYILPNWSDFLNLVNKYIKELGGKVSSTTVSTSTTDSKLKYSPSKTYPVPSGMKFYTDGSKNVITKFSYKAHANYFLSPHFQVKEFVSMSGNKLYSDEIKIHNRLIEMLEALYAKLDCKAVIINSGYRTNQHSIDVGGYAGDTHSLGQAVDITCLDKNGKVISAKKVCCTLEDFGNVYGIGYISESSVHVDTRAKSKQWFGDETKSGAPNIKKLGYKSFHDYFKM